MKKLKEKVYKIKYICSVCEKEFETETTDPTIEKRKCFNCFMNFSVKVDFKS